MAAVKVLSQMSPEEIRKKYGVNVRNGKIAVRRHDFYAVVEGKRYKIDPRFVYSTKPLDQLFEDGTPAGFIIVDGQPIVIIGRPGKYSTPVMCYIVASDVKKRIDNKIRSQIINTLITESRMPAKLGNQILNELGSRR
jgi:hypothetical protein